MKEVNINEILNLWNGNKLPTMLYIHSPFCKSICKYCVYRGCLKDSNFDWYFNEHLPSMLDAYTDVISKQDIKEIYFGGGTPNYDPSLSNLEKTFKKIRNLNPIEKTIELHYNLPITEETIEKLYRENFNTVILCIQTFNKEILLKNNRINQSVNNLDSLIASFHKRGIRVGIDLIFFANEDYSYFESDIKTIKKLTNTPDEITIAPLYESREEDFRYESFLKEISNMILSIDSEYIEERSFNYKRELSFSEYFNNSKAIRFFKKSSILKNNFYTFFPYLSEVPQMVFPDMKNNYIGQHSILGIGSYLNKDKNTYSKLCGRYSYFEQVDSTRNVRFFLESEKTFFDKIREKIDYLEKISNGREADYGVILSFRNTSFLQDDTHNMKEDSIDFHLSSIFENKSDWITFVENKMYKKE